jgi:hypothetical protein
MKALEKILWAAGGFVAGVVCCSFLGSIFFLGWKDVTPLRAPAPLPAPMEKAQPEAPVEADVGKAFADLRDVFDYYGTQGFTKLGQFPKSDWPARIVYVQEGTNEISFTRKGGSRHRYPGYAGYRLKVVSLEDPSGAETLVVLRSKEKIVEP